MANAINFDQIVIDRVVSAWFEDKNAKLIAVLDQISNFSINNSAETKDKTDAQGVLIKRFYTSKSVEVSGENAVFSMNLAALQFGTEKVTKKKGDDETKVRLPRIMQVAKGQIELPDTPIEGTLMVYGTSDNGLVDTEIQYTKTDEAGDYTYSLVGKTLVPPLQATETIQIKYEYEIDTDKEGARVDQTSDKFPRECKATFQVLCSDICDSETVRALYIVFPKFQLAPDFDWTVDTESSQQFSAVALKDYCGKGQLLYYIAIAEDSDEYDTKQYA